MGKDTSIAWTHHTWSPWWGCEKISPGCSLCYAEGLDKRTGGRHWGPGAPRRVLSDSHWREPVKWNAEAKASGERHRTFPSMCDPFDSAAPEGARDRMWGLIRETTKLDWLLLTKRPENIVSMLPALWGNGWPNVWLGVSAEDQQRWDERVPTLLAVPAAVRFVSVEPMVGPVVPRPEHVRCPGAAACYGRRLARGERPSTCCSTPCPPRVDLVICGGESGPRHRELRIEWVRALVEACRYPGWPSDAPRPPHATAVFVKQDSGPRPGMRGRVPDDLWIQEMPTPASGGTP